MWWRRPSWAQPARFSLEDKPAKMMSMKRQSTSQQAKIRALPQFWILLRSIPILKIMIQVPPVDAGGFPDRQMRATWEHSASIGEFTYSSTQGNPD
jgi:hypothetical protein